MKGLGILGFLIIFAVVLMMTVGAFILFGNKLLYFTHGACWASTPSELEKFQREIEPGSLKSGEFKTLPLKLGKCVDAVVFMNIADFDDIAVQSRIPLGKKFTCPGPRKLMIAAIEKRTIEEKGVLDLGSALVKAVFYKDLEELKEYGQSTLDLVTHCISVSCEECTFADNLVLKGPTEGEKTYCLNVGREGNTYTIIQAPGKCES